MEENKEMLELLKKMEESGRKQLLYTRILCVAVLVAVVCFAAVCLMIRDFLPQLETVLRNLEKVTTELAVVDFEGMVKSVNTLVATGQTSLEETVTKLNAIDFESLNKAIKSLSEVVEPLASFFKVFK